MSLKPILGLNLFFFIFLHSTLLLSQTQRFNAGIIAGLNFAELEGDGVTDYFGLNTGLIGTAKFSKHGQLGVEILFSQNGEYILPTYYPALEYGPVRLNHLEIPIHVDLMFGSFGKEEFYHVQLSFGTAYTRLMSYKVQDAEQLDVSDQVVYADKDIWLLQSALTYQLTQQLGLNLKASLPIAADRLDWTLAARLVYMLH